MVAITRFFSSIGQLFYFLPVELSALLLSATTVMVGIVVIRSIK